MSPNPPPVRVCLYARVSTLLGQDPENQLIHLRQFCEARGFQVVAEHVDRGISGAKERRPALDQLVLDARQSKFKIVIVAALDRLSRSTKHFLGLAEDLAHYKVTLISLRENLDFTTPVGQMVLTVIAAISTLERQIISERIRNTLAAKKMAARQSGTDWRCGRPIVMDEAKIAEVRALRAKNLSIRKIAAQLGISKASVQRALGVPATSKKTGGNHQ